MKKLKIIINTFTKMMSVLSKKQKKGGLIFAVMMIITSLFELMGVALIVPFISVLLNSNGSSKEGVIYNILVFFNIKEEYFLITVGCVLIIVFLLKNIILLVCRYIQNKYCLSVQKELSIDMLNTYMSFPYEYYLNTNTSIIKRGAVEDTQGFFYVFQNFMSLMVEGLTVLLIVGFIFINDWKTALFLSLIMSICVVFVVFFNKKRLQKAGVKRRESISKRDYSVMQIVGGMKEICVARRKKEFVADFDMASEDYKKAELSYMTIQSAPERVIECFIVIGIVLVSLFRIAQGVEINTYISQLAAMAMSCFRLIPSVSKVTNAFNVFLYYEGNFNNVYETLKTDNKTSFEENHDGQDKQFNNLSIEKVSFKYEGREEYVFDDISFEIKKGEAIGIIGESGAGKTTFVDLILGLLNPDKGEIEFDKKSIYKHQDEWSDIVGYVPQNVYLVDDTIRNNILFGMQYIDDKKIWEVLRMAQIDKFIEELPDGLDTIVGERGIKFSGGQRQRIAISRALYKNPKVLVLDEATSALDNETEYAVMEAVEQLRGKITLIIIAHRLTTIKNCDRIVRVKDKKIQEVKNL